MIANSLTLYQLYHFLALIRRRHLREGPVDEEQELINNVETDDSPDASQRKPDPGPISHPHERLGVAVVP